MGIGLGGCTAENEEDFVQYGNCSKDINQQLSESLPSCFTDLTADVHLDVSNGIGNPTVVFTPVISDAVAATARFRIKVEVQPLADCDDVNSDMGSLLSFGVFTAQNVNAVVPTVSILPANLPLCYKWRFVFEGLTISKREPNCYSKTIWYESPLF